MSEVNKTVQQKLSDLSELVTWFQSPNFKLEDAVEKFKTAETLAEEIEKDLECYHSADPDLGIKHIQEDEYELYASLCEREWKRKTKIQIPVKQYKNLVIGGLFYDTNLKPGIYSHYYRMYDRFGIGKACLYIIIERLAG